MAETVLRLCLLVFSILLSSFAFCQTKSLHDSNGEAYLVQNADGNPGGETLFWPWDKTTFKCPFFYGVYPNPSDCSSFFVCVAGISSKRSCPPFMAFDKYRKMCLSVFIAVCDKEPTILTTDTMTTTPEPMTTTPKPMTTTPEPTTTTLEPTTTTEATIKPTPPETDCNENDLDCIIDDTGVTPDWFTCPVDIGSYPHPISTKLFIFCLNWIPSVKKCGQDLVYSNELGTCVEP